MYNKMWSTIQSPHRYPFWQKFVKENFLPVSKSLVHLECYFCTEILIFELSNVYFSIVSALKFSMLLKVILISFNNLYYSYFHRNIINLRLVLSVLEQYQICAFKGWKCHHRLARFEMWFCQKLLKKAKITIKIV